MKVSNHIRSNFASQSPRWFHLFHEKTRHFSQPIIWTAPWLSLSPRKTLTSFFFYFLCFVGEAFVSVILDPQNWNGHLRQADMNPKLFFKVKPLFEKSSAGVTENKIRHLRNWNSSTILKTLERVERVQLKNPHFVQIPNLKLDKNENSNMSYLSLR